MTPVYDSIEICIKLALPSKALKTNSENLPEILYIFFLFFLSTILYLGCLLFFSFQGP